MTLASKLSSWLAGGRLRVPIWREFAGQYARELDADRLRWGSERGQRELRFLGWGWTRSRPRDQQSK